MCFLRAMGPGGAPHRASIERLSWRHAPVFSPDSDAQLKRSVEGSAAASRCRGVDAAGHLQVLVREDRCCELQGAGCKDDEKGR